MTALNDAERAAIRRDARRPAAERATPAARRSHRLARTSRYYPAWLPSRRFIAAVIAIGGMQLLATMDSTVAIVALPKIQDELSLSDAGRSWVITAYVLTFGGLMLLGGRLGDTIGRKRTFIVGVALFTIASVLCGVAWDEATLVIARLSAGRRRRRSPRPTGLALVATTFPKGPARNAATAVFAAMTGIGSVMGLVVGGALTEVSWRLAFLVNVPIGLVMIYLARTTLRETHKERMKLDATGRACWPRWAAPRRCSGSRRARRRAGCRRSPSVRAWSPLVVLDRVRHRRAHRGKPRRAVRPVQGPQPGGHVRARSSWPAA